MSEDAGAPAYALVAVAGHVFGSSALENFKPLGTTGTLLSGCTIPVLSVGVGVEVTGAVTLILSEFVDQMLIRRRS